MVLMDILLSMGSSRMLQPLCIFQAALDQLVERVDIDPSQIVVFGRSLGGAVGASLAKDNSDKVAALILETSFTSILDMAGVLLPFLRWFIDGSGSKGLKILNCVVRSPWFTVDIISQVSQPILFLSGLQDEVLPPLLYENVYAKAAAHNRQCTFVEFPTGIHTDTWLAGGSRQLLESGSAVHRQSCYQKH